MSRRSLYIVDGHSHLFRAYHAVGYLSTSKGVPSHAVLILSTMLWKLIREEKPDYLGIAWDPPGPTFRDALFTEYKATRTATITLAAGDSVRCVFTNRKDSKIVIVKDVQNPSTDPEDFSFTTTGTGLSAFLLDDDADPTLSNTKVFQGQLHGQTKTVVEGTEANFTLTSITCSTGGSGSTSTRTATIAAMAPAMHAMAVMATRLPTRSR